MQPQYNLLYREEEREMDPPLPRRGTRHHPVVAARAWRPVARPRDKSKGGTAPPHNVRYADNQDGVADWEFDDVVGRMADQRGVPMARVAMAWLLSKRDVTAPIVGATKLSHLEDAIAALDLTLTADEVSALEAPYTPKNPVF